MQRPEALSGPGVPELAFFKNLGSVEIPDLTSIPEIRDEPVFDGYRKGGCRSGGGEAPKNVMKNDDFYRAKILFYLVSFSLFLRRLYRGGISCHRISGKVMWILI